jgi:threonine dehydrogenase-like Zn-dependent dehydrogenase
VNGLVWKGINRVGVEQVPDPSIRNDHDHDVILRTRLSATCGSDLHLLGGYVPATEKGDVLGHEFLGEVVEIGKDVTKHKVGDRVVVNSFVACGRCWYCRQGLKCTDGATPRCCWSGWSAASWSASTWPPT